jgi:voltage-gated potassium channel Kch
MPDTSKELKNTTYEAFIGVLSLLSIVNLALIYLAASDAVDTVIVIMNGFLSAIFFADFTYRFVTAGEGRWQYFVRQFGWADLVASLPLPQVKILRIFRVFRAYRLGKEYGVRNMARTFWEERAQSALLAVLLFIMLLLEFGSMAMVWAEEDASGANITTGGDAVWWAYVTITTVGYGDQFPVTTAGRIIGVLVMTGGVALFGVLTGFLANVFLAPKQRTEAVGAVQPNDATGMLAEARRLLDEQDTASGRLRARLDEIERLLLPAQSE